MSRFSFLFVLIGAAGCEHSPSAPEEHADHPAPSAEQDAHGDEEHEAIPRRLRVSKQVIDAAGIRVQRVERKALSETLALPGEIAADPDRLARLSAPAAGRIEEVRLREGMPVKKGDPLVVIRVPEIARARASYLATQGKATAARADAKRLRTLFEQQLGLEQDALNAEAEASALELEARSSADELGALGAGVSGAFSITLRAPISGLVVERNAVVGQPASTDQVLATIADLGEVWFLARVFEKDLGQLQVDSSADVHLNAYPSEHFPGSVEYVGQQIDPVARTVTARVRLKNPKAMLRIGLFGTCQVSLGTAEKAEPKLVVPEASVTEIGGKDVVFVRQGEGEFELHDVTLGREAIGNVEILAGLREGEEVVFDGVFTLKGMLLKSSFAEDEH